MAPHRRRRYRELDVDFDHDGPHGRKPSTTRNNDNHKSPYPNQQHARRARIRTSTDVRSNQKRASRRRPVASKHSKRGPPPPTRRTSNRTTRRTAKRHNGDHNHINNARQRAPTDDNVHINLPKNSIHNDWKKQLGGLIQWYITRYYARRPQNGMLAIERMYTDSGCSIEGTKQAILRDLNTRDNEDHPNNDISVKIEQEQEQQQQNHAWIDFSMVLEEVEDEESNNSPQEQQKSFHMLPIEKRQGEGPAFHNQIWNVVCVPPSAVGKSYFFHVTNKSTVDLSCEITVDGKHVIATNAPIPAKSNRTIKPDNNRYFQQHKWIFHKAQRIKLQHQQHGHHHAAPATLTTPTRTTARQSTQQQQQQQQHMIDPNRYNGIRPDYFSNGTNTRVSLQDYPDPTKAWSKWTFTGSSKEFHVEYYEQKVNLGTVFLDFHYTSSVLQTTLVHSSTGEIPLYHQSYVTSQMYRNILQNPRMYTNAAPTSPIPAATPVPAVKQQIHQEQEQMDVDETSNTMKEDTDTTTTNNNPVFFAKNDNYNFQKDGHVNRTVALQQLQPTIDFQTWETASKQEWACIHAKFYVSNAKRTGRRITTPRSNNNDHQRQSEEKQTPGNNNKKLKLPKMVPVIDIKAAENAVLSTKFHPIATTATTMEGNTIPKIARCSNVRMKRIFGINNDPKFKTDPLFENKLYYRAHNSTSNHAGEEGDSNDDDSSMMQQQQQQQEKDVMDDDLSSDDEIPLVERLQTETKEITSSVLEEYKTEKCQQLHNWHHDYQERQKKTYSTTQTTTQQEKIDQANEILNNCLNGIHVAQDTASIDQHVTAYWDWNQQQEWSNI